MRAYIHTDVRMHSVYSDKIHFLQLYIKCSAAKSCPGTHTALQVPVVCTSLPRFMQSANTYLHSHALCTCVENSLRMKVVYRFMPPATWHVAESIRLEVIEDQ